MAKGIRTPLDWRKLLMVFLIGMLGLWLVGQFVTTDDGIGFTMPEDIGATAFTGMKFLVVGALILGAYAIFMKFGGGTMSKKDVLGLVVLLILAVLLWDKVIQPLINAQSLDTITFGVVKKIGIIP